MNKYKRFGSLSSSVDPEKLATKVKGIMLMASTLVIFVAAKFLNINLTPETYVELVTDITGIVAAIATAYGFVQHLVVKIAEKKPVQPVPPQA